MSVYAQGSDPAKRRSAALTDGVDRAPARAMLKAVGFTDEDLAQINEIIDAVGPLLEGRYMNNIVTAFAVLLAEDAETKEDVAEWCGNLALRSFSTFESFNKHRKMH